MKIIIIALNEQSKKALQQHQLERAKLPKFHPQKLMYNKLFEELVISEKPYTLQVRVKAEALGCAMQFQDFKAQIETALLKNGAKPKDYKIKRVKD